MGFEALMYCHKTIQLRNLARGKTEMISDWDGARHHPPMLRPIGGTPDAQPPLGGQSSTRCTNWVQKTPALLRILREGFALPGKAGGGHPFYSLVNFSPPSLNRAWRESLPTTGKKRMNSANSSTLLSQRESIPGSWQYAVSL